VAIELANAASASMALFSLRPTGTAGTSWVKLPCPPKPATAPAVAPGPGLARRRRARSAVTMRWRHVQRRAWPRLTWVRRAANQGLLPGARLPVRRRPV